ncbi:uncharacterized protein LOC130357395 [Hyla sarda]|uniref:uncharacterized protein LOC130357395 n=1 Tax=Hyla sarda TaxID=327740 RepID=UPI0024C3CDB1|nr:uncharacterized protein LOC130357395 [Hyla sarda]
MSDLASPAIIPAKEPPITHLQPPEMRALMNILVNVLRRRRQRQLEARSLRLYWVHPKNLLRDDRGHIGHLYAELRRYPDKFYNFVRMPMEAFDNLLAIVGPHLQRYHTHLRKAISPMEHLLITLRFLATGKSYASCWQINHQRYCEGNMHHDLAVHAANFIAQSKPGEMASGSIRISVCCPLSQLHRRCRRQRPTSVHYWSSYKCHSQGRFMPLQNSLQCLGRTPSYQNYKFHPMHWTSRTIIAKVHIAFTVEKKPSGHHTSQNIIMYDCSIIFIQAEGQA